MSRWTSWLTTDAAIVLCVLPLLVLGALSKSRVQAAAARPGPPVLLAPVTLERLAVSAIPEPAPAMFESNSRTKPASAGTITPRHVRRVRPLTGLCMSPGSNAYCQAAFAAALQTRPEPTEVTDVVVTASGSPDVAGPLDVEPLPFHKRAPWIRRLEAISREGLQLVRVPSGPDREFVVGVTPDGEIGFALKQTDREPSDEISAR